MTTAIQRLVSIASPISQIAPAVADPDAPSSLLELANGFYAFEGALHVLTASATEGHRSLAEWNAPELWRSSYSGMTEGLFFFAEDVFGSQFALSQEGVVSFDPETGDTELLAADIEGWAALILDDYAMLTGYPLARDWQRAHGAIPIGSRLMPKLPFVLGGTFDIANLYVLDAVEGMRVRGDLATQLRDLPDGAQVRYTVVE